MLFDQALGNVFDDPDRYSGREHDRVPMQWRDCSRRAVRAMSERGLRVDVLLPLGRSLRHGDVLSDDGTAIVVVDVVPCEVLVADFADAASLASAALELGNLHVPAEAPGGLQLVTLPDGPVRGMLERYACGSRILLRRLAPLRATVLASNVGLAPSFRVMRRDDAQLINSRE